MMEHLPSSLSQCSEPSSLELCREVPLALPDVLRNDCPRPDVEEIDQAEGRRHMNIAKMNHKPQHLHCGMARSNVYADTTETLLQSLLSHSSKWSAPESAEPDLREKSYIHDQ